MLALPTLQRQLARAGTERPKSEDELVALLELDPLATVRALRASSAFVFRTVHTMPSVREVVRALGPTLSKRLFRAGGADVPDHAPLQQLWRHAIATAFAARDLAARTGMLEPEVAYLVGLLHDLPTWLHRLDPRDGPRTTQVLPTDWILHWQLPAPFVSLMLAIDMGDRATSTEDPPDPAALIRAAELLAELAGFRHPGHGDDALDAITSQIDPSELHVARQLQDKVEAALARFGLAGDDAEAAYDDGVDDATPLWRPTDTGGQLDEVVLSILGCTRSESYRGIITALTAASVRYGYYDRAFYAKWNPSQQIVTLRSKADSSARRMQQTHLHASPEEATMLQQALETQTPVHLAAEPNAKGGLLRALSTDELLAIPLNQDFETPAFLLLDRSLTLTPIDPANDMTLATMLGMTGSLLIQNLLLRRRRQRAQKFALTDPLTRLFNRRMGIHALEQSMARTERDRTPLTVLMCDLDHFKRLNDTLGHVQGDAALRATADVLRHTVRKSDTVCRYGGEEFLVVLPDTTPDEATVLATRMFTAVHARGEELGLPMTISIGLTSHRFGDSVESILMRADRALYASKGYGRNRFSADVEADDEEPLERPPGTK
jgi:diguanylate cyclase (GGDEF)-like protein